MQHTVRFLGILETDLQYKPGLSCFLSWDVLSVYLTSDLLTITTLFVLYVS
jgi:hypothetical protein